MEVEEFILCTFWFGSCDAAVNLCAETSISISSSVLVPLDVAYKRKFFKLFISSQRACIKYIYSDSIESRTFCLIKS